MPARIRRIRLEAAGGAPEGYRLGGACPAITADAVDPSEYGFLGVFPVTFEPSQAVSVFVSRRFDDLFDAAYKVNTAGAVLAFVHEGVLEPDSDAHRLLRGAYDVHLGPEEDDEETIEGQVYSAASGNKIGGQPNLFRDPSNWEDSLARLASDGFVHYLQLDVPKEGEPTLDEEWPFPDGVFHLYLQPASAPVRSSWLWEF